MAGYSQIIETALASSPVEVSPRSEAALPRCNRWTRKANPSSCAEAVPPAPVPTAEQESGESRRRQRRSTCPSYILQHYHSTGCCGGAFSWRAAMLDPAKDLFMCTEPREYRKTTMEDIEYSLSDKRRGGGPRVGPFQETIPGEEWHALPKYDFTTRKRSSAFNERMHVEWENHVDHILANHGELPIASVVAKAGFRSCSPCCRDMLALAKPTGKTFIMVDLAENDRRGTFHFVTGGEYLPVPKEACSMEEVAALKRIVTDAQNGAFHSSTAIYDAVMHVNPPVDEVAQEMYLNDTALLPEGCALGLSGQALLQVLHAEHFARLPAEYGASILRDETRTLEEKQAVRQCRTRAREMLLAAWAPQLEGLAIDLEAYVAAAVAPLLPDDATAYAKLKASRKLPSTKQASLRVSERRWIPSAKQGASRGLAKLRLTAASLNAIDENTEGTIPPPRVGANVAESGMVLAGGRAAKKPFDFDDGASMAAASTALPDDDGSTLVDEEENLEFEDPQDDCGRDLAVGRNQ